ncbi:hypothetical protein A2Y83_04065 [Candidatus Falkowbacteria bacterium RBG_13_39_14]|uniref:Uncharacterized protein n=1 Tax=Candidatus Falkowbacteria bacterium RBG_13_39_14 TaxID=1797985 RepID=A0A1F5S6G1_9BACT|nr:MAG: hypothetical protein A2Y83_04065 [Candidatus Falkowbacteria bacterium RBG_13_39_14]
MQGMYPWVKSSSIQPESEMEIPDSLAPLLDPNSSQGALWYYSTAKNLCKALTFLIIRVLIVCSRMPEFTSFLKGVGCRKADGGKGGLPPFQKGVGCRKADGGIFRRHSF